MNPHYNTASSYPKSLICYAKSVKYGRTGVVVAFYSGDKVKIGWSAANLKAGDKFDKEESLRIAFARCDAKSPENLPTPPHRISKMLGEMEVRAARYYKTCGSPLTKE